MLQVRYLVYLIQKTKPIFIIYSQDEENIKPILKPPSTPSTPARKGRPVRKVFIMIDKFDTDLMNIMIYLFFLLVFLYLFVSFSHSFLSSFLSFFLSIFLSLFLFSPLPSCLFECLFISWNFLVDRYLACSPPLINHHEKS